MRVKMEMEEEEGAKRDASVSNQQIARTVMWRVGRQTHAGDFFSNKAVVLVE